MEVKIDRTGEEKESHSKTVKELLKELNLNPTTVIVVVNGDAVTEDAKLQEKDKVRILSVVSGG